MALDENPLESPFAAESHEFSVIGAEIGAASDRSSKDEDDAFRASRGPRDMARPCLRLRLNRVSSDPLPI